MQVLSSIALLSFKVAKAPRDKEHPYGHSWFVPTRYSILILDCAALVSFFVCVLLQLCSCFAIVDSGHGKFETLGALGISCMLLGTAGGIGWHALDILMVIYRRYCCHSFTLYFSLETVMFHVQGLNSANPEVVSQSLIDHNHQHSGHHHGVDMEHPSLALSMTVLSIAVKEGYRTYNDCC